MPSILSIDDTYKPVTTSQPVATMQPVVASKQPTGQPTIAALQPPTLRPSIKNSGSTAPQQQPSQPSIDSKSIDPSYSPTITPTPFGTPWPGFSNRTNSPTTQNNVKNIGAILGIVFGTLAVVVILLAVLFVWNKRRKQTTTAEAASASAATSDHDNHHSSIRWYGMPWKRRRAQDDDDDTTNHDHIHAAIPRYGTLLSSGTDDYPRKYKSSGMDEEEEMIEFYDVEMQKAFVQEQEKKIKGSSTHDDSNEDDDDDAPMNESSEHTPRTSSQSTTSIDNISSEGIQPQQQHANILPKRPESSSAPESESQSGSYDSSSYSGSTSDDMSQSKSYSGSSQHSGSSYSGSHTSSENSHTDKNYDDSYGDIEDVGDLPLPPPKQIANRRSSPGAEVQQQNRRIPQSDDENDDVCYDESGDVAFLPLKPPAPVRQAEINKADKPPPPPPPPPIRIKLSREDPSVDSSVSHHHRISRRYSDSSDDATSIHDASFSGNSIFIPTQSPAVGEDFAAVSEMENIKALIKEISTLEMALQAYPKNSQAWLLLSSYLARVSIING